MSTLPPCGWRGGAGRRRYLSFAVLAALTLTLAPPQRVTLAQRPANRPPAASASKQLPSNLPGIDDTDKPGPHAFFYADVDAGVAGVDTLYVADDRAGQIKKYSLVSGAWAARGSVGAADVRGLTGVVSGTGVTLHVTHGGNAQSTVTDAGGYNATMSGALSTNADASANNALRGVAPAPAATATYLSNAATPERKPDPAVSYSKRGAAAAAGSLIISEFRFRGPGLLDEGTAGPADSDDPGAPSDPSSPENDEFVEFYNNTDSDIAVSTTDGSPGWALVGSDGLTRFIIPNDTVIPARGYFLAANTGYSLETYGQPDEIVEPSDPDPNPRPNRYTQEIPDGSGIALFGTAEPANYTLANRLDAAGYATVAPLYREGAGFPAAGAEATSDLEHSFVRRVCVFGGAGCGGPGLPQDTADNGADFVVVNAEAAPTTLGAKLGAPGPQGLTSPVNGGAGMVGSLLDPSVPSSQSPNRVRDPGVVPNGDWGTLSIRRTVTNNTGAPVRYLGFRIIEITTTPVPAGTADLRALDSCDCQVPVDGDTVDLRGTYVEQPPLQNNGGGLNSSMAVGYINLANQLEDGDSVNVQFLLGVMETGAYRFYLNIEMINDGLGHGEGPASSSHITSLRKLQQEQQQRRRPRRGTR